MPTIKVTTEKSNSNKSSELKCKLCDFKCTFASQLIQHSKKNHMSENKTLQNVLKMNVHIASNDKTTETSKGQTLLGKIKHTVDNSKKEITIKKIKLNDKKSQCITNTINEDVNNSTNDNSNAKKLMTVKTFTPKSKEIQLVAKASNKNDADKQQKEKCQMDESFKCSTCNYVTKNRTDIVIHRAEHDDVFACTECEYKSTNKNNYERHEWCHVVDYPFKCQHCSFSSHSEKAVKRHTSIYHNSLFKDKRKHSSGEVPVPMKILKSEKSVTTAKVIEEKNQSTTKELIIECIEVEGTLEWHCNLCDLYFDSRQSVNKHTKDCHKKPLKDCIIVGKVGLDEDFDMGADMTTSENQPLVKNNHSAPKMKSIIVKNISKRQKEIIENKNIFKCAHCSFTTNEFEKLKNHLEKESMNPNHKAKTTIDMKSTDNHLIPNNLDEVKKLSIPKVIKIDKPNHVPSPKNDKIIEISIKQEPTENSVKPQKTIAPDLKAPLQTNNLDDSLLPFVEKLKVKCLCCKYMTYSAKCLKKHLLKEHSKVIINKKLLQEFTRKCFIMSLENASQGKNDICKPPSKSNVISSDLKTDSSIKVELLPESENIKKSSDQSNNTNCPQKDLKTVDHPIKPNNTISGDTTSFFKCSQCNKTYVSDTKLKKLKNHIKTVHPNAKIHHVSNYGENKNKDITSLNQSCDSSKNQSVEKIEIKPQIKDIKIEKDDEITIKQEKPVHQSTLNNGKIGMADELRIKRFKCSVCPYRSNFRNNISNHVHLRHASTPRAHYTVMSVDEARQSLPFYSYKRYDYELYSNDKPNDLYSKKQYGQLKEQLPQYMNDFHENDQNLVVAMKNFDEDEPKKCRICPFVTNKSEILKLHMNYHQPQKRNELSCPYCPFFVNTTRLMRHHLLLHETSTNGNKQQSNNSQLVNNSQVNNNNSIATHRDNDSCGLNALICWNVFINNFKFCKAKYICEYCPFTSDERGDYWCHRKCHFERDDRSNNLKCDKCQYWAEDKKDFAQHISLHDLVYSPKVKLNQSDLSIGEFCRCDLADFRNFPDLACFKQLDCNYCSYKCSSVQLMRQHSVTHVAFADAKITRLFMSDLDDADEVLGNLCTRLLNMNYSLAAESFNGSELSINCCSKKEGGGNDNDINMCHHGHDSKCSPNIGNENNNGGLDDSFDMPVLEKVCDLVSLDTYDPDVLSIQLPSIASSSSCDNSSNRKNLVSAKVTESLLCPNKSLICDETKKNVEDKDNNTKSLNVNDVVGSFLGAVGLIGKPCNVNNTGVEDTCMLESTFNVGDDGAEILSAPEELIKSEQQFYKSYYGVSVESNVDQHEGDDNDSNDVGDDNDDEDLGKHVLKSYSVCPFAKAIFMNSLRLTSS